MPIFKVVFILKVVIQIIKIKQKQINKQIE